MRRPVGIPPVVAFMLVATALAQGPQPAGKQGKYLLMEQIVIAEGKAPSYPGSLQRGDTAGARRLADLATWPGNDAAFLQRVTSEDVMARLYLEVIRAGSREKAIALLEWTVEQHPRSATAFDVLADAYEAAGRKADSRTATEKVLQLLEGPTDLPPETRAALRESAEKRLKRLSGANSPHQTATCVTAQTGQARRQEMN